MQLILNVSQINDMCALCGFCPFNYKLSYAYIEIVSHLATDAIFVFDQFRRMWFSIYWVIINLFRYNTCLY